MVNQHLYSYCQFNDKGEYRYLYCMAESKAKAKQIFEKEYTVYIPKIQKVDTMQIKNSIIGSNGYDFNSNWTKSFF